MRRLTVIVITLVLATIVTAHAQGCDAEFRATDQALNASLSSIAAREQHIKGMAPVDQLTYLCTWGKQQLSAQANIDRLTSAHNACLRRFVPGFNPPSPVGVENLQRSITTWCQGVQQLATMKKPSADADTCEVGLGPSVRTSCIGPGKDCSCLSLSNTCPYPVSVSFRKSASPGRRGVTLGKFEKNSSSACSTRDGSETVEYLGWVPQKPHPRPGEPKPRGWK
jgi:hypothetical protein